MRIRCGFRDFNGAMLVMTSLAAVACRADETLDHRVELCCAVETVERIGPEGGDVALAEVRLFVPPGALDEATEIRLVRRPAGDPCECGLEDVYSAEPFGLFSRPYELGETGMTLVRPFVLYWEIPAAGDFACPEVSWTREVGLQDCYAAARAANPLWEGSYSPCYVLSPNVSEEQSVVRFVTDRLGHFRLRTVASRDDPGMVPDECAPVPRMRHRLLLFGQEDSWMPVCVTNDDCGVHEYCDGQWMSVDEWNLQVKRLAQEDPGLDVIRLTYRELVDQSDEGWPYFVYRVSDAIVDVTVRRCPGERWWGECVLRPQSCDNAMPVSVCGCDGRIYESECEANRRGVTVRSRILEGCADGYEGAVIRERL